MTQVEEEKQLTVVSEKLSNLLAAKIKACPKNFNQTRFLQNCLVALQGIDPVKLAQVTPESVALTMIKGAFLGLDFANRECYAIPFGNQLQFLTDYKGDIKLCRQYSVKPIKDIYAKVVREGDNFIHKIENGSPIISFIPASAFNDAAIIGAFAVVIYEDGTMAYETMSKKEIEATRNSFSKCAGSPAWVKAWGEMAKKTVLKRVTKMIEITFDNTDQTKAFQDGGDLKVDPIDVEAEEVKDPFKKEEKIESSDEIPEDKKIPEDSDKKTRDQEGFLLQIQSEIEKFLVANKKQPSLIFKYALDIYGKKLFELTVDEMVDLKTKVVNGAI